jgi:hypothetical protein
MGLRMSKPSCNSRADDTDDADANRLARGRWGYHYAKGPLAVRILEQAAPRSREPSVDVAKILGEAPRGDAALGGVKRALARRRMRFTVSLAPLPGSSASSPCFVLGDCGCRQTLGGARRHRAARSFIVTLCGP